MPLGSIAVKGKSELVSAFKLIKVISGVEGFTRHFDSPMIGRENEKGLLTQAYERVRREGTSHLFTVLGSVGVGKSRLVSEFLTAVAAKAIVLQGRCLNYGEGITFYPVAEVIKQAAGIVDEDSAREILTKLAALMPGDDARAVVAERLAQMMGVIEATASAEEIAWSVRKLLEALARVRPVVVLFDDIHWGEPTFLDLVEQLADWSRDTSILLVCTAREELLDKRPSWGGERSTDIHPPRTSNRERVWNPHRAPPRTGRSGHRRDQQDRRRRGGKSSLRRADGFDAHRRRGNSSGW